MTTDPRYFRPDASCDAFLWTNVAGQNAPLTHGRFRLAPGYAHGVIAEAVINSGNFSKDQRRLRFTESLDETGDLGQASPINGALVETQEFGSDGLNYQGYIMSSIFGGSYGSRNIRHPLRGGMTYAPVIENSLQADDHQLSFFGWGWSDSHPRRDIRDWFPDETCYPIAWETNTRRLIGQGGGVLAAGQFRVVPNRRAVFRSACLGGGGTEPKGATAINFQRDKIITGGAGIVPQSGIPLNGCLVDVREKTETLGTQNGFAIMGCAPYEIALVLEPGIYFVQSYCPALRNEAISFFGWCYNPHPRKTDFDYHKFLCSSQQNFFPGIQ